MANDESFWIATVNEDCEATEEPRPYDPSSDPPLEQFPLFRELTYGEFRTHVGGSAEEALRNAREDCERARD